MQFIMQTLGTYFLIIRMFTAFELEEISLNVVNAELRTNEEPSWILNFPGVN